MRTASLLEQMQAALQRVETTVKTAINPAADEIQEEHLLTQRLTTSFSLDRKTTQYGTYNLFEAEKDQSLPSAPPVASI